jgi:Mannosyltransferase putative
VLPLSRQAGLAIGLRHLETRVSDVPIPRGDLSALAAHLKLWFPDYPPTRFSGRGIVVCAGGASIFTNAYVLVWVLRRTLDCTLPIEVWHFGSDEMSPSMASLLAELDATTVNALPLVAAAGSRIGDGWQLKSFAIQHCRFEQVLLLDADQVPVRDPAECFDWPEFEQIGAVFWPDIVELREDNPVWQALGLAPALSRSIESGQVLVDKRRHWRPLSIAQALNEEAELLYRMIYGDKDTLLVAWRLADADFVLLPHLPFIDERCLIQRDFSGEPFLQHRTNAKWSYWGEQFPIEGFRHLDACLAALAHLRAHWNGTIVHLPDRSPAARAEEARLSALGQFEFEILADEKTALELLPLGEIGEGRAVDRQNWWCEGASGKISLVIAVANEVRYRLSEVEPARWEGISSRPPQRPVALTGGAAASPALGQAAGLVDDLLTSAGFPDMTAEALEELRVALRLVCRVDAGALARLQLLAAGAPETYRALLERLDDGRLGRVRRDMDILSFYQPVGHNGAD